MAAFVWTFNFDLNFSLSIDMRKKKTIAVDGFDIRIGENDFISISDIAKRSDGEARHVLQNWLKNSNTIRYLYEWERIHNPEIKGVHLHALLEKGTNNRFSMSPDKWINSVNAIGLRNKKGRGGGAYAHKDIALNFCYWLDPLFQIYFIKEFQRLKEEEFHRLESNRTWHISKITDYVDNARVLLDSIPGQLPENVRIFDEEE